MARSLDSWISPGGYHHIGPCRRGMEPHAFFLDPTGKIVHASRLLRVPFAGTDLEAELKALREEKVQLEKRIQQLEELKERETQK